jgi:hypothetical protein
MAHWYVTEYGLDRKRAHPRPQEISVKAPSGGADVVWRDDELGSLLAERGICHLGRTTSYSDGSTAIQVVHLDNGNWLVLDCMDTPFGDISEEAMWASACPKACWHGDDRKHVIHPRR